MTTIYICPRRNLTPKARNTMRKFAEIAGGALHPTAVRGGVCIAVDCGQDDARRLEAKLELSLAAVGI